MTVDHRCHAEGCSVLVLPRLFMCAKHWALVPYPLREMIRTVYESGQERTKAPSARYVIAARRVIGVVAQREGLCTEEEAIDRVIATMGTLVQGGRLGLGDLDALACWEPLFGRMALQLRMGRMREGLSK